MPGAGAAREGGGEEPDEDARAAERGLRELGAANTVLRAEVGVGASVVGAHARATSGGGARAAGGAAGTFREMIGSAGAPPLQARRAVPLPTSPPPSRARLETAFQETSLATVQALALHLASRGAELSAELRTLQRERELEQSSVSSPVEVVAATELDPPSASAAELVNVLADTWGHGSATGAPAPAAVRDAPVAVVVEALEALCVRHAVLPADLRAELREGQQSVELAGSAPDAIYRSMLPALRRLGPDNREALHAVCVALRAASSRDAAAAWAGRVILLGRRCSQPPPSFTAAAAARDAGAVLLVHYDAGTLDAEAEVAAASMAIAADEGASAAREAQATKRSADSGAGSTSTSTNKDGAVPGRRRHGGARAIFSKVKRGLLGAAGAGKAGAREAEADEVEDSTAVEEGTGGDHEKGIEEQEDESVLSTSVRSSSLPDGRAAAAAAIRTTVPTRQALAKLEAAPPLTIAQAVAMFGRPPAPPPPGPPSLGLATAGSPPRLPQRRGSEVL
jgi:hypothetical protein